MAVLTDSHSKRVLFDPDGEAIDGTDFNDMQLATWAQLLDNLLLSLVPDAVDDPTTPGTITELDDAREWNLLGLPYSDMVFAPAPACGYIRAGSGSRELVCVPGPLLTIIDEPFSATGETVAPFRLGVTSLATAVGDATNARIDLVEVKLEFVDADPTSRDFEDAVTRVPSSQLTDKTRRTQLTIQIKQGTASATPAYPTPTAGFVALAAVYVPAAHNAVHNPVNIRDLRWPLGGVQTIDVLPNQFVRTGSNPWTLSDGGLLALANTTGTDPMYAPCPIATRSARVIGVAIHGQAGPTMTCELVRFGPAGGTPIADLSSIFSTLAVRSMTAVQLMDKLGLLTEGKGTRAASTRVGSPIWCNGYAGGPAVPGSIYRVGVKIACEDTAEVSFVRFVVATGL